MPRAPSPAAGSQCVPTTMWCCAPWPMAARARIDAFAAAVPGAERRPSPCAGRSRRRCRPSGCCCPASDRPRSSSSPRPRASPCSTRSRRSTRTPRASAKPSPRRSTQGVDRLLLALGGSASTDGGVGALAALGARFLDASGRPIRLGNRGLGTLARVDLSGLRPLPPGGAVILGDVDNPLLGARGAAAVFGPQKGADAATVDGARVEPRAARAAPPGRPADTGRGRGRRHGLRPARVGRAHGRGSRCRRRGDGPARGARGRRARDHRRGAIRRADRAGQGAVGGRAARAGRPACRSRSPRGRSRRMPQPPASWHPRRSRCWPAALQQRWPMPRTGSRQPAPNSRERSDPERALLGGGSAESVPEGVAPGSRATLDLPESNRFEAGHGRRITSRRPSGRRPCSPAPEGVRRHHRARPGTPMSSTASIPIIRPDDYNRPAHPGDLLTRRQRLVYVLVLGALTALGPFTVDLYLPAFPVLQDELGVSAAAVQLTLTGTMVGFGFGQLIVGPWSDKVGRTAAAHPRDAAAHRGIHRRRPRARHRVARGVPSAPGLRRRGRRRRRHGDGARPLRRQAPRAHALAARARQRPRPGARARHRLAAAAVHGLARRLLGARRLRRRRGRRGRRSSSSRRCRRRGASWPATRPCATATPRSSAIACTSARRSSAA